MAPSFDPIEAKMRAADLSDAAVSAFKLNFDALAGGESGMMPEAEIKPVESLPRLEELRGAAPSAEELQSLLSKTAVLKLNGGLGTSMGLEKAKSLLPVKDGKTFLDLIALQVKHTREATGASGLRFVLMNSFSTSEDTRAFLAKDHAELLAQPDSELLQNKSPKLDAKTLEPVTWAADPDLEWCPPGHGDIYPSLLGSGMLKRLIDSGVEYLFVSNSDNLGATLQLDLLAHFAKSEAPFLMEVAERTAADKKGGHLAVRLSDGRLTLRESAQCLDDDKAAFEDITKHKFFNTNNLWINLPALSKALESSATGAVKLPLIKNKKTVDPRDASSTPVFQLETAMGSAIELFDGAAAVVVPRERFAPVKTTNDLFLLRSDAYVVDASSVVVPAVKPLPKVDLDAKVYKLVDAVDALVPADAEPSLKGCTSLRVVGKVKFSPGTVFKGDVLVKNESANGEEVVLPAGEYSDSVIALPVGGDGEGAAKEEKKEEAVAAA